ncbi:MAG: dienelactone hydrolase family protein [Candidatus Poribacteria bacterium]|nr:dienelactone hydrolase family protein [Candidatus Poribacteria bacterium]
MRRLMIVLAVFALFAACGSDTEDTPGMTNEDGNGELTDPTGEKLGGDQDGVTQEDPNQPVDNGDDPGDEDPNQGEDPLRRSEWVNVDHGGRSVATYVSYPAGGDPTLAIVLIHENVGMADWLRDFGDEIADAGYIALSVDLLSGMAPGGGGTANFPNQDAARQALGRLPPNQVTADLTAVADFAAPLPTSNGMVAVAGFCWGGAQSFRFATNYPKLAVACVFYGDPPNAADIGRINAPVYGFYGGTDGRINATIPQTEQLMGNAGKFYEAVIYDGAGHAFMRRATETANPADPNVLARAASWQRLRTILADHN